MNDYTPNTDYVRETYTEAHYDPHNAEMPWATVAEAFDRWLAEHDAALVAERDAGQAMGRAISEAEDRRSIREHIESVERERDTAREQLAQAEAVIAEALAWNEHEGWNGPLRRILSGYPVSSALAARDAEKWQEGVDALALSTLPDAPPLVNPYRVTPTEEPKP